MSHKCKAIGSAAFVTLVLVVGVGWCAAVEQAVQERAQRILDTTGTKGGLIVHLGCGDGRLTAALGSSDRFFVQGLDQQDDAVAEARQHISATGVYGRVSARRWDGRRLPYVDNLVNMIVASGKCQATGDEIARVLAPGGVLMAQNGSLTTGHSPALTPSPVGLEGWSKFSKPRSAEIDEWTHFLHGPDNNAVAQDRVVGPPVHLQWLADPRHLRSHEHLNSLSALVSAQGRIFYIIDEGPTASVVAPPAWRLVARDAFNGVFLWKRDLGPWEGHFRLFRSGPPDVSRRLVAVDDRVYATLGYGKRVAAFDAATGDMVRVYDNTEGAVEIIYDQGRLFVLVGSIDEQAFVERSKRYYPSPEPRRKGIVAVDADSGEVLWKQKDRDTAEIMPTNLAVAGQRLFFQNTTQLVCLDAFSGREKWRADRTVYTTRLAWSAPTLVACDDVVLSADGSTGGVPPDASRGEAAVRWIMSDTDIRKHPIGDLVAFSAETGKRLWTTDSLQGFCCPGDIFVMDGLVWSGAIVAPGQQTLDVALDLETGEVKKRRSGEGLPVGGHARCYRNKATERFLVLGGTGVEFVDVNDGSWTANSWLRGTCQYGVMPCNGLLYVPPDSCACRPNARLHGFTAMASEGESKSLGVEKSKGRRFEESKSESGGQLERGPVYGEIVDRQSPAENPDDWATYRKDGDRSGRTKSAVAAELRPAWQTEIGGRLTSLTAAGGRVFVSRVDEHTIQALDVDSGEIAWSHTVGASVDSPPTVSRGLVMFGCRDGWVHCLRASDGEAAWRFRAAPDDRFLMAPEGIESAWPVHGSVLVRDDLVWFAAGRSSYLDGGIRLIALQLASGNPVVTKMLDARDPDGWITPGTGRGRATQNRLTGTLPDILSTTGDLMFMGWTCFDTQGELVNVFKPHLFSATGFLDDTWWHRTYWQYGAWMRGGFGGWPQAARQMPAGRLLVIDDDTIFGFGRSRYDVGNPTGVHAGHVGVIKDGYQDSGHVDHSQNPYQLFAASKPDTENVEKGKRNVVEYRWQTSVPILVRAMLLADRTLFIAGPDAGQDNRGLAGLRTAKPGRLLAVSADDGSILTESELAAAPVLDGMAAIPGRLLVSCTDGSVRCFVDRQGDGAR